MSPAAVWEDKVYPIAKPKGPSSFAVVRALRKATDVSKAGHAGSLDPLGEGLLLICTGKATRAVEYLMDREKEYEFDLTLGVETSTLDGEGEVVRRVECSGLPREEVERCLRSFVGGYLQEPPAYSALKRGGRRLYRLARAGRSPQVEPRPVTISALALIDMRGPLLTLSVRCSRGMYVRALARDIAAGLGLPGHVSRLVRKAIGDFRLEHAFPAARLFRGEVDGLEGMPLVHALAFLPALVLGSEGRRGLLRGVIPPWDQVLEEVGEVVGARVIRLVDSEGRLIAVGTRSSASARAGAVVDKYRLLVRA